MKKWMISLIWVFGAVTVSAATADADEPVRDSLETAREKLDEAAGMFSEYIGKLDWQRWDERPFLGILIAREDAEGIRVASVTPGGGAEEAGIQANDLIVRANDADLTGSSSPIIVLHKTLDDVEAGGTVKVEVLRDGEPLNVDVVPQRGAMGRMFRLEPGNSIEHVVDIWPGRNERRREKAFGFKLVDVGESLGAYFGVDGGVLVLTADDDGELLPGDVLQRVGDDDVTDADAAYLALAEAEESTRVVVRRNGKRKTLAVEPIEGVKVRKSIEYSDKARR